MMVTPILKAYHPHPNPLPEGEGTRLQKLENLQAV